MDETMKRTTKTVRWGSKLRKQGQERRQENGTRVKGSKLEEEKGNDERG